MWWIIGGLLCSPVRKPMTSLMRCLYVLTRKVESGIDKYTCIRCGHVTNSKYPAARIHRPCKTPATTQEKAAAEHAKKHGPGAQLQKLIKRYTGEGITASCKCARHIAEMNQRGPEWCKKNVETIVGWLLEEVQRRIDEAKKADKPAPWRVRLGGMDLPGRRLALRRLVLKAVRKAEKAVDREAVDSG